MAGGPNTSAATRDSAHLLTHTSGLPHSRRLADVEKQTRHADEDFAEPLDYEPGTKEVYSDLDYLMAEIIERLTGRKLDDLAHE